MRAAPTRKVVDVREGEVGAFFAVARRRTLAGAAHAELRRRRRRENIRAGRVDDQARRFSIDRARRRRCGC